MRGGGGVKRLEGTKRLEWSLSIFLSGRGGVVSQVIEGPGKEICYAACVQSDNRGRWTGTTQDYLANGRMIL